MNDIEKQAEAIKKMVSGENFVLPPMASNMTLRDHFAGLAMQGMMSNGFRSSKEDLASGAYVVADAMMEARKP